jgi:hypothetical protein
MSRLITLVVLAVAAGFYISGCESTTDPQNVSQTEELEFGTFAKASMFTSRDTLVEDWYLSGECLGEMLNIHYVDELIVRTKIDGQGGYHSFIHWRPIATVAIGEDTGGEWRPVGAVPIIEHYGKLGEKYILTSAGCYNWKAQQDGPNLIEPWTVHITVNADGETIVSKEHIRFICKPEN